MKHLRFLLILSLTITLFSCGDDDTVAVVAAPSPNADLLGTWTGTALTATITGSVVDSSDNSTTPYTGVLNGANLNFTLIFTETPNNAASSGTFDTELVIMSGGSTTTITETGQSFFEVSPASWTRGSNTLSITDDGNTTVYSLSLNGATMTLSSSDINTSVDGTETTTATINSIATFTKQ